MLGKLVGRNMVLQALIRVFGSLILMYLKRKEENNIENLEEVNKVKPKRKKRKPKTFKFKFSLLKGVKPKKRKKD